MKKKKDHDFSEIICQSHLDKGFYCSEKALCATLYSHSHMFHRHRSLPLPCSAKASFARCYRAVQWKQFLTSGAEPSYLPPLIQEKDRKLQTVSIPDILFPAPKLPFPFLKKVKATVLKPAQSSRSSITGICHRAIHKEPPGSTSLLQSLKETTLTSARATADKSKHSPAQNTCFFITA